MAEPALTQPPTPPAQPEMSQITFAGNDLETAAISLGRGMAQTNANHKEVLRSIRELTSLILGAFAALSAKVTALEKEQLAMSGTMNNLDQEITALTTQVTNAEAGEDAALTMIQGISAQIAAAVAAAQAAGATPQEVAQMVALGASLDAKSAELAAAVAANTPAPPTPPTGP